MFHSRLMILFCAVLLASACAAPGSRTAAAPESVADTTTAPDDSASAPAVAAAADDDPLVCKRVTQTGSRVAQRICKRQSVIDAEKRGAEEMLGEVQKRGALDTTHKK